MFRSIIQACLARSPLVIAGYIMCLAGFYAAFRTLNIEAYPDPSPPIIEVIAQWPGQSPEEVERYVTIPIEIALSSTPCLKFTRSNTVYALGFIRLQFEYGCDYNSVRQKTINRLKDVTVPAGVAPVISPAGGISDHIHKVLQFRDETLRDAARVMDAIGDIFPMLERARYGIEFFGMNDIRQGIVHIIGPEQGWTLPGTTIVCGDSHTSTHGAFGALAFGIGTSEVEHVLASDAHSDVLAYDKQLADQIGVRGVPFFVFNQKIAVPGAESVETLIEAMTKASA